MPYVTLSQVAVLLAAMAIAAPLARWLGVGAVLGYLVAGVLLGPHGLLAVITGFRADQAKEILHFAEFGVVLLLFVIGLELRPKRLWAMRSVILGLGGAQVMITALILAVVLAGVGIPMPAAVFTGFALALSSTALALQAAEESGELALRHGRLAFGVLLLQDLAAIPLIALAPLFGTAALVTGLQDQVLSALRAFATIAGVVLVGRFALDRIFRLVALTKVREAMTAAALLTVVSVTLIMQQAGLSASLGAFLAGALLAESSYRHQIEADIKPFEGLLLGLFFTAIGMSLDLSLFVAQPLVILGAAGLLVVVKTLVLYGLGRWWEDLAPAPARRLGLMLSQGGEFAFVLLTTGAGYGILEKAQGDFLAVVVTLSMVMTPLLLLVESRLFPPRVGEPTDFEAPPSNDGHVIIAGFGRFGQIVARILRAKRIPFTALDIDAAQVELVKRFGAEAFFGDVRRPEILEAAKVDKARAFVLAIDDVEASLLTASLLKTRYPDLPVFARARNRNHAHRLLDLGVTAIQRETFGSAIETTRQVLRGLGMPEREITRVITTFRTHDERRLIEDYKDYTDLEKLQDKARSDAATLERLFSEDAAEQQALEESKVGKKDR